MFVVGNVVQNVLATLMFFWNNNVNFQNTTVHKLCIIR